MTEIYISILLINQRQKLGKVRICINRFGLNLLYTTMIEDLDHHKDGCWLIFNVGINKKRQSRKFYSNLVLQR